MRRGDNRRNSASETMAIFRKTQGRVVNKFAVNGGKLFVDIHTEKIEMERHLLLLRSIFVLSFG